MDGRDDARRAIVAMAVNPGGKQLVADLRGWGITNPNGVARDLIGGLLHAGYAIVPRKPTEEMLRKAFEETAHDGGMADTDRWMLENIWRAMIDAALAE